MPATLLLGRPIAEQVRGRMRAAIARRSPSSPPPCLAGILIGADSASRMFAASQARAARDLGIEHRTVELPAAAPQWQAAAAVAALNTDPTVHGVLLYQPLPASFDLLALQSAIAPSKDVEGVNPANLGRLALGQAALPPCTAAAAIECIQSTSIPIAGMRAVVVGRSPIVGRPAALMLIGMDATVTVCHSRTRDLVSVCREAEILVVAVGKPRLIGREHIRNGAIVIDVGTHKVPAPITPDTTAPAPSTITVGDVRTDEAAEIASYLTPVPGGVGPVTVAMLMENVVRASNA